MAFFETVLAVGWRGLSLNSGFSTICNTIILIIGLMQPPLESRNSPWSLPGMTKWNTDPRVVSLLKKGCSIRSLCLYACAFHPEQGSCSFRSLRRVHFSWVHITTEETGTFLSNPLTLEHLELWYCNEIACLRIPCTVQELSYLRVGRCSQAKLEVIESDAPNISTFHYEGPIIPFSLGDSHQLKDIRISIYPWVNLFDYARKKLPTIAPNVETLFLMSDDEIGAFYNLWIAPQERLIHLKHLELAMVGPRTVISFHYRYLFLVPFLITCPALETFILHVCHICVSKCDLFLLLFSYLPCVLSLLMNSS